MRLGDREEKALVDRNGKFCGKQLSGGQYARTHWQRVGGTNQHLEHLKMLIPLEEEQLELRNQKATGEVAESKDKVAKVP